MLGIVTFPFERRAMVYFCEQFLGSGLTEKSGMVMGDPHPSRLRRATFPQGKARSQVCFSFSKSPKHTVAYKFFGKRKILSLAFPAGEGADQLLRREADEGGSRHRLFRQTTDL
jgi:hypothetical protein